MRSIMILTVGLTLTAALWAGGPGAVFAEDKGTGQDTCDSGPAFVPGARLGPVQIGMPLDAAQRWFGRPRLVENRTLQGHRWTHMQFTGADVFARDNSIMALNVLQTWPLPVQTRCSTVVTRPFSLPLGYVRQTYGPPVVNFALNGLQYWLYNSQGLVLAVPPGANYVQGLTVYPAGQFCTLFPVFISFGGFNIPAGSRMQCPDNEVERER